MLSKTQFVVIYCLCLFKRCYDLRIGSLILYKLNYITTRHFVLFLNKANLPDLLSRSMSTMTRYSWKPFFLNLWRHNSMKLRNYSIFGISSILPFIWVVTRHFAQKYILGVDDVIKNRKATKIGEMVRFNFFHNPMVIIC